MAAPDRADRADCRAGVFSAIPWPVSISRVWYAVRDRGKIIPKLELTDDEALLLKEILQSYLGDLRMEIADTDLQSFRNKLRSNEELIKRIIDRLGKMDPAAQ